MPDPVSLLLADEHVPDQVTFRLRKLGHDVVRVRDLSVNKAGDGDDDRNVLAAAIRRNRAVVTENWPDFLPLHRANPGHKGIIASRQYADWKQQAKEIDAAIRFVIRNKGRLDGQFIRVPFTEEDESKPIPLRKSRRRGDGPH